MYGRVVGGATASVPSVVGCILLHNLVPEPLHHRPQALDYAVGEQLGDRAGDLGARLFVIVAVPDARPDGRRGDQARLLVYVELADDVDRFPVRHAVLPSPWRPP